ncbi:DNA primase [Profundibacterium mesophilum]|nr:DNA primase [Profundibacterium mesophilum]
MSLPPGFLDELRSRISLSQVVGRKVSWDARKSNQGKGDMWASCPFHQEKSASFHVDDRKGFFYCFGCHAKGDAIGFVKDSENVGFMEAVQILAAEAGLPMPQRDPVAQQRSDRRGQLAEVMEQAVQWFRLQLRSSGALGARDYLEGRGIDADAVQRWEIGFAPENGGLLRHLREKGIAPDLIEGAGLVARSDRGGDVYERFRGRIIYPIRDARGRAMALGGRAMDPNARAKYLNSPETELFDKGRSLYNHAAAREAAGKGAPLIVAEGYMDVIALAEAGFAGAVAPLGTAITEHQLRLLWRISPEPVIALDGDTAGLRAAMRLIDVALPLLEAGQSLRFCILPEGRDPDDLLRSDGPGAIKALLERSEAMVDLLWRRETEGRPIDSPERRAALDKALREALARIADPSIRSHYAEAIKERRQTLFAPRRTGSEGGPSRGFGQGRPPGGAYAGGGARGGRRPPWAPLAPAQASTRASILAAGDASVEDSLREAVILAVLLHYPKLLARFEEDLDRLDCARPEFARLAGALLAHAGAPPEALRENVESVLGRDALENLMALRHLSVVPALRDPDEDMAALCLAEEFAKLAARRGARREIDEAVQDFDTVADEGLTWRLGQAAEALQRAQRSETEDRTEYEIAPNGVRMNRREKSALDGLLDKIGMSKEDNSRK